ncbi:MAPEG family protein [Paraglaciecola sp.]|uniref:MAPEG family protein n=1 Tax=Paraglaciecola sp. TaxID=1920173 RepID=UPI0030F44A28
MNYVHIVAALAIFQFIFFGVKVGQARGKYNVAAPATSGHDMFDRAFRIHMNTLEQLVGFLPALFMASVYWSNAYIAMIGAVYIVGRFVYQKSYLADPKKRSLGFALTILPTFVLLVAAIAGAMMN